MKIIIDISEDIYKKCQTSEFARKSIYFDLVDAIRRSTILPKGHGRLIDADNITLIDEQFYTPSDYYIAENSIEDAPTIIETEMENE